MLTCKSLFGLGYRGERLIEPFDTRWLRVRPEKAALVGVVAGKIVKLRGHVAIPSVGSDGRKTAQTPGLITRGYPHNPKARRNPQPSPKSPL